MSRQTFVYCPEQGRVVPKGEEAHRAGSGVTIIRDFAESVVNPMDGKAYSSRTAYEAATRRAGGIEIGKTEHAKMRAAYEARGHRGIEVGPTARQSVEAAIRSMEG